MGRRHRRFEISFLALQVIYLNPCTYWSESAAKEAVPSCAAPQTKKKENQRTEKKGAGRQGSLCTSLPRPPPPPLRRVIRVKPKIRAAPIGQGHPHARRRWRRGQGGLPRPFLLRGVLLAFLFCGVPHLPHPDHGRALRWCPTHQSPHKGWTTRSTFPGPKSVDHVCHPCRLAWYWRMTTCTGWMLVRKTTWKKP